jgi:hypothetical protein
MNRKKMLVAAAGVAGTAVVAGSLVSVGSVNAAETEDGSNILGRAAEILGIQSNDLEDAFTSARNEAIDTAVEDGRLSEERAEEMKENELHMFEMNRNGEGRGPQMGMMKSAAEYLEMEPEDLRTVLESYDTVAEYIESIGEDPADLEAYLLQVHDEKMQEMSGNEDIDEERFAEMEERGKEMINKMIYETPEHQGMQGRGRGLMHIEE